jgi:hypothetical protein
LPKQILLLWSELLLLLLHLLLLLQAVVCLLQDVSTPTDGTTPCLAASKLWTSTFQGEQGA